MTKTTYYCDLCKEESEQTNLFTIFYEGACYVLVEFGNIRWSGAHKHICKACVKMIHLADVDARKDG